VSGSIVCFLGRAQWWFVNGAHTFRKKAAGICAICAGTEPAQCTFMTVRRELLMGACVAALAWGCGGDDSNENGGTHTSGNNGGGGTGQGVAGMGGVAQSPLDATWEAITIDAPVVAERWGHVAALIDDDLAVMFGGTRAGIEDVELDDVWLVDASGETVAFEQVVAAGPAPRYCGCAVYDPDRGKVISVGGRDLNGPLEAETWELDVAAKSWKHIGVALSPPGVIGCAIARQ